MISDIFRLNHGRISDGSIMEVVLVLFLLIWTYFKPFSSVAIIDFEQVNVRQSKILASKLLLPFPYCFFVLWLPCYITSYIIYFKAANGTFLSPTNIFSSAYLNQLMHFVKYHRFEFTYKSIKIKAEYTLFLWATHFFNSAWVLLNFFMNAASNVA